MKPEELPDRSLTPCQPLSDDELLAMLSAFAREGGSGATVNKVRRKRLKHRADWRGGRLFERVMARLSDGTACKYILKYFRPCRDLLVHEGVRREVDVYRTFLADGTLDTPRFFGADTDEASGQTLLVIEYVEGKRLKRVYDPDAWVAAAKWLGRTHGHFSERLEELRRVPSLRLYDDSYYLAWLDRAAESTERVSSDASDIVNGLRSRYEQVAGPLGAEPFTLLHGEFYCTNVLAEQTQGRWRIVPFDWETAGIGCGALDLAYLMRQNLGVSRRDLIGAYLEGWQEVGSAPFSTRELRDHIVRAKIHELIYFLWSSVHDEEPGVDEVLRQARQAETLLQRLA